MPYIVSVILDFDLPDIEVERTTQLLLQQEEVPTLADIARELPGVIAHMIEHPRYEFQAPAYANAAYTFTVEAIFHVIPLD